MHINRRLALPLIAAVIIFICLGAGAVALYRALIAANFGQTVKDTAAQFDQMFALRTSIQEEFEAEDVGIQVLNGNVLVITLTNTPYMDSPTAHQRETALEIARFAHDSFEGASQIETYQVSFVKQRTILGFTAFGRLNFQFTESDLEP